MTANSAVHPPVDLGPLQGGQWYQYASYRTGQPYYVDCVTGARSFAVPQGYEDLPTDTWGLNSQKPWPQWTNARTGRSVLIDPQPVINTYLDYPIVKAHLTTIQRIPESPEHIFRIPLTTILTLVFSSSEAFSVVPGIRGEERRGYIIVSKIWARPLGTPHQYDYMVVECKDNSHSIADTEPQLQEVLATSQVKDVYGLIQCGLDLQFYKHENGQFQKVGKEMHIVDDATEVQQMLDYTRTHPLEM